MEEPCSYTYVVKCRNCGKLRENQWAKDPAIKSRGEQYVLFQNFVLKHIMLKEVVFSSCDCLPDYVAVWDIVAIDKI